MTGRTEAQRQASSANARLATEGKRRRAEERRKEAETRIDDVYGPVRGEILLALQAVVAGDRKEAATRIQKALLSLAAAAVSGIFDPVRHRACMNALRETQGRGIRVMLDVQRLPSDPVAIRDPRGRR